MSGKTATDWLVHRDCAKKSIQAPSAQKTRLVNYPALSALYCCCSRMKGGLPACCLQTDGPLVALHSCIEMDGHEWLQSIREGVLGSGAVFARGFRGLTPKNRLWSCTVRLGGNDCSQLSCIGWFSWPGLHEHGPGQQTWLADQIALPCLGF